MNTTNNIMPAISSAFKETHSFQNSNNHSHLLGGDNTHDQQDTMKAAPIRGAGIRNQRDQYNSFVKKAEIYSKDENLFKK